MSKKIRKQHNKQLKKRVKRKARNAAKRVASSVASAYVGRDTVQLVRSGMASIGRSIKPNSTLLGACASRYLRSFLDPFTVDSVCVPIPPAHPSWKIKIYQRGVCFIGTAGFGFVGVAPSLCADRACIYATTADYNQSSLNGPVTDLTFSSQASGGNTYPAQIKLNAPFNHDLFTDVDTDRDTPAVEGRIVSASLRVQYAGRAVDQQGLIVGISSPNAGCLTGDQHTASTGGNGYRMAEMMSFPYADVEMNKRQMTISVLPSDLASDDYTIKTGPKDEFNPMRNAFPYTETLYRDGTGGVGNNGTNLRAGTVTSAIAFTGTPGSSVYYEYVQHVEYKGTAVAPRSLTQSEVDYTGYTIVKDILMKAQNMCANTNQKTFQKCVYEVMGKMKVQFGSGYRTK